MRAFFRVVLYLAVIELLVTGGLCLLSPSLAGKVWGYRVQDPALVRVLGPPWIVIGIMWLVMASDLDRYRRVVWVPIVGTVLQCARAAWGAWSGELPLETARPQLLSEAVFAIALIVGYVGAYRTANRVGATTRRQAT